MRGRGRLPAQGISMNTTFTPPKPAAHAITRRRLLSALPASLAAAWTGPASAQAWPAKPIRIVAAQAPGSSNDNTARAFADYLSTQLGVPVTVENKPGGIGMIAAELVAHSAPDGYTLLITLHSQLAQAPVLLKKVPIDPYKDLVPIAAISTGVGPMVVKKDLPVNNLAELIELARKRPVTVGNYGIGSGWQLQMVQLARQMPQQRLHQLRRIVARTSVNHRPGVNERQYRAQTSSITGRSVAHCEELPCHRSSPPVSPPLEYGAPAHPQR